MNSKNHSLCACDRIKPLAIWSVSVMFIVYQIFLQFSMGVLIPTLINELHFSSVQISIISISFYLVYIPMQIPSGLLIDKYGTKRLIQYGALVCALGCMLLSITQHLFIAIIARVLMGAGASCAFVSCVKLSKTSFALKYLTLLLGIAETSMMLGTMLGVSSFAHSVSVIGWRQSIMLLALIGMVISLLSHRYIPISKHPNLGSQAYNLAKLFNSSSLWLHGVYIGLMFSPISVWASTWAIPYVMKKQSIELNRAVLEVSFAYLGMAVMSPMIGLLMHALKPSSKWYVFASLVLLMIVLVMIYADNLSFMLGSLLFFTLGICASITMLNYAEVAANEVKYKSSQAVGFVNAVALTMIPLIHMFISIIF